jgi:hypothetical protein
MLNGLLKEWKWQRDAQNSLMDQEETFTVVVPLCGAGASTLQAAVLPGKLKRTMGVWSLGPGEPRLCQLQAFNRRMDTLSVCSPICRVK